MVGFLKFQGGVKVFDLLDKLVVLLLQDVDKAFQLVYLAQILVALGLLLVVETLELVEGVEIYRGDR